MCQFTWNSVSGAALLHQTLPCSYFLGDGILGPRWDDLKQYDNEIMAQERRFRNMCATTDEKPEDKWQLDLPFAAA